MYPSLNERCGVEPRSALHDRPIALCVKRVVDYVLIETHTHVHAGGKVGDRISVGVRDGMKRAIVSVTEWSDLIPL